MKLTITDAAKNYLQKYLREDTDLLLDLDDGVGPISLEASCQFDIAFRVILVNHNAFNQTYDKTFNADLPIRYKSYSETYMDDNLKLDWNPKTYSLTLSTDSGTLSDGMTVIDNTQSEEAANSPTIQLIN